jgi:hypothetical protein
MGLARVSFPQILTCGKSSIRRKGPELSPLPQGFRMGDFAERVVRKDYKNRYFLIFIPFP